MKNSTHYVLYIASLILPYISIHVAAATIQLGHDGAQEPSSARENIASVMLSDHDPIDIPISPDGSLAHVDLEQPLDVTNAVVLSEVAATCFFWRYRRRRDSRSTHQDKIVSYTFSSGPRSPDSALSMFEGDIFAGAERLYCYDSSREDTDGDVFTLFFETGTEAAGAAGGGGRGMEISSSSSTSRAARKGKLLRIKIDADAEYVSVTQQTLARHHADLLTGTKAKLIDWPRKRRRSGGSSSSSSSRRRGDTGIDTDTDTDTASAPAFTFSAAEGMEHEVTAEAEYDEKEENAGCFFLKVGDAEVKPASQLTDEFFDVHFRAEDVVSRIVCFRDLADDAATSRWQRETFSGA